jgi:hypothetical protein
MTRTAAEQDLERTLRAKRFVMTDERVVVFQCAPASRITVRWACLLTRTQPEQIRSGTGDRVAGLVLLTRAMCALANRHRR